MAKKKKYTLNELEKAVQFYIDGVKAKTEDASVAAFALYMGRCKDTVIRWAKSKETLYNSFRSSSTNPVKKEFIESDDWENPIAIALTAIEAHLNQNKDVMSLAQCNHYFGYREIDKAENSSVKVELAPEMEQYAV